MKKRLLPLVAALKRHLLYLPFLMKEVKSRPLRALLLPPVLHPAYLQATPLRRVPRIRAKVD